MGFDKKRTMILIPAFNEESTVGGVIEGCKPYGDVLVVCDRGTDGTVDAIKGKCSTIVNDIRMGKGFALRKGFMYGIEKGYDNIVMIDADGERDPKDIPRLLDFMESNSLDIVLGTRDKQRSGSRKMLNRFTNWWISIATGYRFYDALSGFNAIRADALRLMNLNADGFEIETEMALESQKIGLSVGELPVRVPAISESKFRLRHGVMLNNFFDIWVLRNISRLKIGRKRKLFIALSGLVGLVMGTVLALLIKKPVSYFPNKTQEHKHDSANANQNKNTV